VATSDSLSSWLAYRRPNPQARLRLFCFPYAGGSASTFGAWPNYLPAYVEVCPVQLPGREGRLRETPYRRLEPLIDALAQGLLPAFDKPFAFFGHSMGALISFELTRYLRRNAKPQPVHLFLSGARAPHTPDAEPPIHHLGEKEFIEAIKRLDGTPQEVLQHEELMQILLPYLRADFEVCETHAYQPEEPLSVPVTAFGGWQDKSISPDKVKAWCEQTSGACNVHMFAGGHFFLHSARAELLQTLSGEIESYSFAR
jgi:medium-chain acyl-[acyl-carrier-protein] hydrolase